MKSSKLFKWKNFRNHVSETCKINYAWDRFTDMTFIVQKRRVTAHKIILSANSEFFKMILNETPSCVHPTITLPDVNYEDLDAIMKFIYTGELLVHPERLESVLSLASCFQVKSLMKVQAALIKENDTTEIINYNTCDVPNILASRSENQPKVTPVDILPSRSENQPKVAPVDILPSRSQNQPKVASPESLASRSQNQPKVASPESLASRSQNQPIVAFTEILASGSQNQPKPVPTHKKEALNSQKTQRKKKSKDYFKSLVTNEKVGQTSSGTATGELKKKKGKGVSKSEILIVGGKSNVCALAPKSGVAPRSSYKCIKENLLREFEKGGTIKEVSKLFNISPSCAFYYKKCFVKAGKLSPSVINCQKKALGTSVKNKNVAENMPQNLLLRAEVAKGDRYTRKKMARAT